MPAREKPAREKPAREKPSRENGRGKSRADRDAAKHKPHRTEDRFYKAKHDAQHACEDLRARIRRSQIHEAVRKELVSAVDAAESRINDVSPTRSHPGAQLRDITKEVGHLAIAENWLAAADRVMGRLGGNGPRSARARVEEEVDAVMWHIRAGVWDGRLTASVTRLQQAVQDAENHAAHAHQAAPARHAVAPSHSVRQAG